MLELWERAHEVGVVASEGEVGWWGEVYGDVAVCAEGQVVGGVEDVVPSCLLAGSALGIRRGCCWFGEAIGGWRFGLLSLLVALGYCLLECLLCLVTSVPGLEWLLGTYRLRFLVFLLLGTRGALLL